MASALVVTIIILVSVFILASGIVQVLPGSQSNFGETVGKIFGGGKGHQKNQTSTTTSTTVTTPTSTTTASTTTTRSTTTTTSSPVQPNYIISTDGTTITALNIATGKIDFSGTDAAVVIMKAAKVNSKVLIKAGTYVIRKVNNVTDCVHIGNSNVELYGEGQAVTILKEDNNANCNVIGVQASNVYIHDFQVDGNRMNQAQGTGTPATKDNGILAGWYSTNVTISKTYVHDNRNVGIDLSGCTNCQVLNNLIVNSDANGITIDNQLNVGSGAIVRGNIVDGASDVGITAWYANNFTAENNTVRNVTMNRSPYGVNSHVGMYAEQASKDVTYRNNYIENCGMVLAADWGTNIRFDTITAHNCLIGLWVGSVNGLTMKNSVFDGIPNALQTNAPYWVFGLDPGVASAIVTGNQFINVGPYLRANGVIIELRPSSGTFSNNIIDTANGKYPAIDAQSGWTLQNNTIT